MWQSLAKFVIKNRIAFLLLLLLSTVLMGYYASKVKLSYEFSKAIPTDNQKYVDYQAFKKKFGDDGNLLVVGVTTQNLFTLSQFKSYQNLQTNLKKIPAVEDILSVPTALNLKKDSTTEKLTVVKIFADTITSQAQLDSAKAIFYSLPFYKDRLYNQATNSFLMAVKVNKEVLATKERTAVIAAIEAEIEKYKTASNVEVHTSGLPLIRTLIADRVKAEMKLFLLASLGLSVLILLLFFRSISTTLLSLAVVLIGVIFTVGTTYLCGYQITLLTALIPSLVVVIGIPNCIYFINKYHTSYLKDVDNPSPKERKNNALVAMVSKMGVVTLFCNITAAIGFVVFSFTKSEILQEFGVVAGISIMVIFFISFILLPSALSMLPVPSKNELKYLNNQLIEKALNRIEKWVFQYRKPVVVITVIVVLVAIAGVMKLKTVGYIVDDLPKKDRIYLDLKYFEKNFGGVMPLEIMVDTKKRRGLSGVKALSIFEKVDSLALFIGQQKEMTKPLSLAEGLKFAKQGFYEGDSANYLLPNTFDGAFVGEYLRPSKDTSNAKANNFSKTLRSFLDSGAQTTRISISMADVGTEALPVLLNKIEKRSNELFDSTYKVTLTGSSITFLEGSKFIINGLKESIAWAFVLIAFCMLFLFKSFRILFCSIIPNIVPLLVTAGIMGWVGVPLKPSTVLIFSVALGIAIDITIRFLVNYKQVLPENNGDVAMAVKSTIHQTGLSIIYTSLVLTAGFIIFCASSFGGTFALGWLTSVTLLTATVTNLVLLPVLIIFFAKGKNK
ncbi:RND family transporter [Ferruginibacter yonginensis]|uniref:RND family transporter n=1 Tax=Ferruginibacter yonginensis TaxID=1310416 RepID=A0ABV8QUA7_9BACT